MSWVVELLWAIIVLMLALVLVGVLATVSLEIVLYLWR